MLGRLLLSFAFGAAFMACGSSTPTTVHPQGGAVEPADVPEVAHEPKPTTAAETKGPPAGFPEASCADPGFFKHYVKDDLVEAAVEGVLQLNLRINLHGKDCGAPDCWGHDMTLRLELRRQGDSCEIARAEVLGVPFNACGGPMDIGPQQPWESTLVVHGSPDLADPGLKQIELRDPRREEAVLLLPDGYFFYERVTSSSQLIPGLEGENSTGCCYGYTSSAAYWWRSDD